MYVSTLLRSSIPVAALFLTRTNAVPTELDPRGADPTAVWVSVNGDGNPATTVTPLQTTISGTPTLQGAAPYEVTGTIFSTYVPDKTTFTSRPPAPTQGQEGAFARCIKKKNETNAPFCDPGPGGELYVGESYYITWDPDLVDSRFSNTSSKMVVRLRGNKLNSTTNAIGGQSFETALVPAAWGFHFLKIESKYLESNQPTNVTFILLSSVEGNAQQTDHNGPTVLLTHRPAFQPPEPEIPSGKGLYIGLPAALGFIALCVIGLCVWNRKHRKIGLGNVMSRTRHGYGIGQSRARRMAGAARKSLFKRRDHGIQLAERVPPGEGDYSDQPDGVPRHGNSELGGFDAQGGSVGRNAFRDEVDRQDRERW